MYIPGTNWKKMERSKKIEWREAVHWAMNYYAGLRNSRQDIRQWDDRQYEDGKPMNYSGDIHGEISVGYYSMSLPGVCLYRHYRLIGTEYPIMSSFLSYPNAMGALDTFFWEVYPDLDGDITRFETEEEMEAYVKKCFNSKKWLLKNNY